MKLPKKYQGQGRHLFCTKHGCSKTITNEKSSCSRKDVLAKNCPFKEKHVFQSRVWNPIAKKTNIIKSWPKIKDLEEFIVEHSNFKQELKNSNFSMIIPEKEKVKPRLLIDFVKIYFDYLEDIDIPEHEKKHRDKKYINGQKRYLKRFLQEVNTVQKVSSMVIQSVSSKEVEILYNFLNQQDYKATTWNAHIKACSMFMVWANKKYDLKLDDPFGRVTKRKQANDPQIIEESEFEDLLTYISPENGVQIVGVKKKERKQHFRDWVVSWFLLSVFTGARRQEVSLMKCKHVSDNYIMVPNYKVNKSENTDINKSYPPMTADLQMLLLRLGVYDRDPEEYILCPDRENRKSLCDQASKSFAHFWSLTGNKKELTLYSLRRTYITRMIILKGHKGAGVHHKNVETAYSHYFSKKDQNNDLVGEKMFSIEEK